MSDFSSSQTLESNGKLAPDHFILLVLFLARLLLSTPVKLFDDLVDLLYIHLGFKLEVLDNYTEAKGRHTTTIYLEANHVHTMKHIE